MRIEKPRRARRTRVIRHPAKASAVFPLLCPVREADWIEGWDPEWVLTESGLAEEGCVFATKVGEREAVWVVARFEPPAAVEMVKIAPGHTACRLAIALRDTAQGCEAQVTYEHTSLGPEGDAFVAAFTEAHYARFMGDWERRLNHYLATGSRLGSKA